MGSFEVNGRTYRTRELSMNYLCYMHDHGVADSEILSLSGLRLFVAYCGNINPEVAGNEISKHAENGGKEALQDLIKVYANCVNESGFFRIFLGTDEDEPETEEQNTQETPKATRKKSKPATE